jgi:hypothetical protein
MARSGFWPLATLLLVGSAIFTFAQETANTPAGAVVPHIVNFSGSLSAADSKPSGG